MSGAIASASAGRLPLHPVEVLSVKAAKCYHVRFCGPVRGLLTHWLKRGGTVVCQGAECPPEAHKSKIIWKGYAPVEQWLADHRVWRPFVLEVTENLEERLRGRNLVGEVWLLRRESATEKTSPIVAHFCEAVGPEVVGQPADVEAVLKRFYRLNHMNMLGAANPIPPRIVLTDRQGSPPFTPPELQPMVGPIQATVEEVEETRKRLREAQARWRKRPGDRTPGDAGEVHQ